MGVYKVLVEIRDSVYEKIIENALWVDSEIEVCIEFYNNKGDLKKELNDVVIKKQMYNGCYVEYIGEMLFGLPHGRIVNIDGFKKVGD